MKSTLSFILVGFAAILHHGWARDINKEVFNGYTANPGQFPYQAYLESQKPNSNLYWLCGGSLISNRHVLTAAHCLEGVSSTTVTLGLTDQNNYAGTLRYRVSSSQMAIHPNYNNTRFNNDVAMILLPQVVSFNNYVNSIRLPYRAWADASTFDNYYVTVSGWGLASNDGPSPNRYLQYRTVLMMPHSDCVNYMNGNPPVTNGMICTDRRIYAGHCQGDSGGPLAVSLNSGNFLVGVVSWGFRPCVNNGPSVYANVANYLDWINRLTGIPIN